MPRTDILFEVKGRAGFVTLNQPASLNALTRDMCVAFHQQLRAWRDDSRVKAVVVTGAGGRAFCAGGDVRAVYRYGRGSVFGYQFFWDEYRLDAAIAHFPKPYIALIDGICMGGGVGISIHAPHRVITEKCLFAMPETTIGLFPDVGVTRFLAKTPGRIGHYLALSGARLNAADVMYIGAGTAHVPSARISELAAALQDGDPKVIAQFTTDPGPAPIAARQAEIDRVFAPDRVEDIASSELACKSPTSLKLAARQLRAVGGLSVDEVLKIDYRLACRSVDGHDYFEGVRALLIDKDQKPRWDPARLEDVSEARIDAYFTPLAQELAIGD